MSLAASSAGIAESTSETRCREESETGAWMIGWWQRWHYGTCGDTRGTRGTRGEGRGKGEALDGGSMSAATAAARSASPAEAPAQHRSRRLGVAMESTAATFGSCSRRRVPIQKTAAAMARQALVWHLAPSLSDGGVSLAASSRGARVASSTAAREAAWSRDLPLRPSSTQHGSGVRGGSTSDITCAAKDTLDNRATRLPRAADMDATARAKNSTSISSHMPAAKFEASCSIAAAATGETALANVAVVSNFTLPSKAADFRESPPSPPA